MILQSMTDYVLNTKQSTSLNENKFVNEELISIEKIRNYANFLKQPLKLRMFIPCDENDMPLEEPNRIDFAVNTEYFNEYQQAKERVLFKGFELVEIYKYGAFLEMNFDDFSERITILFEDTIEDLLTYSFDPEFELTDSAIKQINL